MQLTQPGLYGRNGELDLLDGLLGRLATGRGGAVVVRGEAGVGKSALLAVAGERADAQGVLVLSATGVECETQLPFAGLHQLLQPLISGVDRLPSPQRDAIRAAFGMTTAAPPELFLIALATLELLSEAAEEVPRMILIEDAQWLDRPSSDVLAFVARRVALEPVAVLIAIRDGYGGVFGLAGLREMHLGPLDDESAHAVLDARTPDLSPAARAEVLELAAGNPLALEELPSVIADERVSSRVMPLTALPITARLERAFVSRVDDLPPAARLALVVAASDDGNMLTEVLAAASLISGGMRMTEEALQPAESARLIEQDGLRISFRHPLVRSAIYQAAGPAQRRSAHGALATVLDDDPARGVWHRAAAALGPDDDVATQLEIAATQAQHRGAIAVAVAALERAARLAEQPSRRGALLLRAAELAFDLGKPTLTLRLLSEARGLEIPKLEQGRLMWIQQMIEPGLLGDPTRIRGLVELSGDAEASGDRELALNLMWLAATRCWWGDAETPVREEVLAAAERLGTIDDDPRLLGVLAYTAPTAGGKTVVDRLSDVGSAGRDGVVDRLKGSAATVIGAFDLAVPFLASGAARLRDQGRLGHLPRVLVAQAWAAVYVADWTVASPVADEAERLAVETDDTLFRAGAQVAQAMVAALRGEGERADALATKVERTAAPVGAKFLLAMAQHVRGLTALGASRYEEAYQLLSRLFEPSDASYHHFIRYWALGDLAEAAVHCGRTDAARALLAELGPRIAITPSQGVQTALRHARAVLAGDDEAELLFNEALSADPVGWPFARGRLQLAYGSWLRRQRRVADSRTPLRAARDSFDAAGATPWAERARQELRASGESSRRRAPDARDQLTPQELQIAQLAASGLSNREIGARLFMSQRTVGSHLYHIFPKLGISSRNRLHAVLEGVATAAAPA
jgi:DNA-binding CsgD family transcriptional regulator